MYQYQQQADEFGNVWSGYTLYSESRIEGETGFWLSSSGNATLLYGINEINGANVYSSYLERGFRSESIDYAPQLRMWASKLDNYRTIANSF